MFNPNTIHHSNPNHHFSRSPAAGSAQVLVTVLLEQVPKFADEARLSLELDSKETPKDMLKYSFLFFRGLKETLAWMEKAVAWPSALTKRRRF